MLRVPVLVLFATLLAGCGGWGFSYSTNKDMRTPLERAAEEGNTAEVKRLLASGSDPNDAGVFGSPLNAAAFRKGNVEVVRMLLSAGANPHGRREDRNMCWTSPLSNAVSSGDVEIARALLDAGASMKQHTCSELIVGWLRAPILDLLVEHGLNLKAVDKNGRNALHVALAEPAVPELEGIEYLVRAGVPLNARDHSGKTPLAYWREPRDYQVHWFRTWVIERLSDDPSFHRDRENRAKISAFLQKSGAY